MAKKLRRKHAHSHSSAPTATRGDCRSVREMADASTKAATISGYKAFIDGDIEGCRDIMPLGEGKPFVTFDPTEWPMPPPMPLGSGSLYPKVKQGWKLSLIHISEPTRPY